MKKEDRDAAEAQLVDWQQQRQEIRRRQRLFSFLEALPRSDKNKRVALPDCVLKNDETKMVVAELSKAPEAWRSVTLQFEALDEETAAQLAQLLRSDAAPVELEVHVRRIAGESTGVLLDAVRNSANVRAITVSAGRSVTARNLNRDAFLHLASKRIEREKMLDTQGVAQCLDDAAVHELVEAVFHNSCRQANFNIDGSCVSDVGLLDILRVLIHSNESNFNCPRDGFVSTEVKAACAAVARINQMRAAVDKSLVCRVQSSILSTGESNTAACMFRMDANLEDHPVNNLFQQVRLSKESDYEKMRERKPEASSEEETGPQG